MLHSTYYHKETNEDPKTSAVFENLMLLPDNVFWYILRSSCFYHDDMSINPGRLLSFQFWCHWNAQDPRHAHYVEPDLFVRFDNFDVIIEAKYSDRGGQYSEQWESEIAAYQNEYGHECRPVVFIAVGGNPTKSQESITVGHHSYTIYKCTWLSLLMSITKYQSQLRHISVPDPAVAATLRLIDNIILAFNINGVYNINWFDSMASSHTIIDPYSIEAIQKHFTL